jgi:aerobic-type carbon monoxide dehydrogenase small subunit (CoxS/CutS family)
MNETFRFRVNGRDVEVEASPMSRLADILREKLHLTGTKIGCGEGECGACTVLLDGEAVMSCLVPVAQAERREILTVEGLARNGELGPLQAAFLEAGGAQCGICTPGMLMAAQAHLLRGGSLEPDELREALAGNICRCTGYTKILDAVRRAGGAR